MLKVFSMKRWVKLWRQQKTKLQTLCIIQDTSSEDEEGKDCGEFVKKKHASIICISFRLKMALTRAKKMSCRIMFLCINRTMVIIFF